MDSNATLPRRNGFAYLLAIFIPYTGQYGAGFGLLVMVYVIGVLAAIAIPAYKDYTVRAKVSVAVTGSQSARENLGSYYRTNHKPPESLEAAGLPSSLADGSPLSLDAAHMVLTVATKEGELIFVPSLDPRPSPVDLQEWPRTAPGAAPGILSRHRRAVARTKPGHGVRCARASRVPVSGRDPAASGVPATGKWPAGVHEPAHALVA